MWIGTKYYKKVSKKSTAKDLDYISLSYCYRGPQYTVAVNQDGHHNTVTTYNRDHKDAVANNHA